MNSQLETSNIRIKLTKEQQARLEKKQARELEKLREEEAKLLAKMASGKNLTNS